MSEPPRRDAEAPAGSPGSHTPPKGSTSIEQVAKVTGETLPLRLSKALSVAGLVLMTLGLAGGSACGGLLGEPPVWLSVVIAFALLGGGELMALIGLVAEWHAVHCPQCGVAIAWYRAKTESVLRPGPQGSGTCLRCGYNPG